MYTFIQADDSVDRGFSRPATGPTRRGRLIDRRQIAETRGVQRCIKLESKQSRDGKSDDEAGRAKESPLELFGADDETLDDADGLAYSWRIR
jgi:hypothetical protein